MSDQQSTPRSAAHAAQRTEACRRVRWKWFPLVWVTGLLTWVLWMQTTDLTRGHKAVSWVAAGALLFVGLSLWFLVASSFSRRARWSTFLLFWAAAYAAYSSVDIINDGDIRWVGWRFVWQSKPDELLPLPTESGTAAAWQSSHHEYPRFLGNAFWAEVPGVELETDWHANPPQELWRKEIGAGWSSFAIVGDYAFTQEQRGPSELVVCYRVSTGDIVWAHADEARFDPATAGAGLGGLGPRATPTVHGDRVFTQGATGIVNCLNIQTGSVVWSHDSLEELGADNLMWGKSGSPLIVDDMVVINVGAPANAKRQAAYHASLVAYDIETGNPRWTAGHRTTAYPSPVLATLAGERQILQINENYLTAHRAADGQVLWEHKWLGSSSSNASCSQPVPLDGNRLFLSRGYGDGASLLHLERDGGGDFVVQTLWNPAQKPVMKTKFGNVVICDGYVYGLDNVSLQCIELESGRSIWKKRRRPAFGHGQIMLIGDTILVLSEIGELALVACTPDRYEELTVIQVLDENDVTWNNPAFSSPYLLVRNSREAVCYKLPLRE